MPSETTERKFEAHIEKALVGTSREERQSHTLHQEGGSYQTDTSLGYVAGDSADFDPHLTFDTAKLWQFLEATQADQLDKLRQQRPDWERLILERLDRKIKKGSVLDILKKGISLNDAHLTLFYPTPVSTLNPIHAERFQQNIFSVTRQIFFSTSGDNPSVDMVIFLNGLPLVTMELKYSWTGQTWRNAIRQYEKRPNKEPLFTFGRCLVHLAVDTEQVHMTTRLNGKSTRFLPLNKGHNHGAGNPPNESGEGYRTAYLWEELLAPRNLARILEHFVMLDGDKPRDPLSKKTLIFPRYHQWDVVKKLLEETAVNGIGHTYLIQHSAGSGKSNSITWLAYQLIEQYDETLDAPLFNSVVIVTDRRVLDKQLRDNIKQFSQSKNIVAPAFSSAELRRALESGKRIIITTVQKFPFIVDGVEDLSDHRFAVIIDEAHSSQSGQAADKMNQSLGASSSSNENNEKEDDDAPEDAQDKILQAMEGRKMGENVSYFAFTATPKNSTLEKFGRPDGNGGNFRPFHLYSMKQAIEEGFILDVVANYTTYQSYYEIEKSVQDNPIFSSSRAQKKLRTYVEGHKETIAVKAGIMVEHFLAQVIRPRKLKGKAKGMVVTRNIPSAIRYYKAIKAELERLKSPIKIIVSFSGKKVVDGIEHSEDSLNGFASKEIEEKFDSDEYRLLVVANKYLTGFDQKKLTTMYVDKPLQGVLAVQALSRLNRANLKLGKRTEDVFVLDFYNEHGRYQSLLRPLLHRHHSHHSHQHRRTPRHQRNPRRCRRV